MTDEHAVARLRDAWRLAKAEEQAAALRARDARAAYHRALAEVERREVVQRRGRVT